MHGIAEALIAVAAAPPRPDPLTTSTLSTDPSGWIGARADAGAAAEVVGGAGLIAFWMKLATSAGSIWIAVPSVEVCRSVVPVGTVRKVTAPAERPCTC